MTPEERASRVKLENMKRGKTYFVLLIKCRKLIPFIVNRAGLVSR